MTVDDMTLEEIRAKGLQALARELGPVGYVRFIQQFFAGRGNFTQERHDWLDQLTVEQLQALLEARKQAK